MKRILFGFALAATTLPVMACQLKTLDSESTRSIVTARGGYPISDAQCTLINSYPNYGLHVDGQATVLNGVNVTWVSVSVVDGDTMIGSITSNKTTRINTSTGSQDVANDTFFEALNAAIAGLDIKKAAGEVTLKKMEVYQQARRTAKQ